jgi:XTP/dITP diphosphohydrolase
MNIWFATNNNNKKTELEAILKTTLKIPAEQGYAFNPEETGSTFLENALIKAEELHRLLGAPKDPVIADDSGICVDALNGRPGIHSAIYGGAKLHDTEKNALLLAELGDNPLRKARFVCAMVLYYSPSRFFAAQETLEGELVKGLESARGSGGFGYDPILYIPEMDRTVAELSNEEKNRLSHRGKAGRAIARIIAGL